MSRLSDVESTSLTHRIVLLGLAELSRAEATPSHTAAVLTTCNETLDAVEDAVTGRLTEADGARALKELEATGLVEAVHDPDSPTGKGRPRYRLAVDRERLLETLRDDDRVERVVDRVADA